MQAAVNHPLGDGVQASPMVGYSNTPTHVSRPVTPYQPSDGNKMPVLQATNGRPDAWSHPSADVAQWTKLIDERVPSSPSALPGKPSLAYITKAPYPINPSTQTTAVTPTGLRAAHRSAISSSSTPKRFHQPPVSFTPPYSNGVPKIPTHLTNTAPPELGKQSLELSNRRLPNGTSASTPASARRPEAPQQLAKAVQRSMSQRKPEHRSHRAKELSLKTTMKETTTPTASKRSTIEVTLSGRHKKASKDDSFASSSQPAQKTQQRPPRRRAVVIGINYVFAPDILLRGCCNDASVMALSLVNLCDFKPEDVILLIDAYPSECYRSPNFEEREDEGAEGVVLWKDRQPTRRNILLALNWLRADTLPGDVLFFYFGGHGIQVDDMSGWEGEGYDEAILPMDFYGEEVNALTAVMIRNLLLSVCSDVQLTMVIDCTGGQTVLDPAGTGGWSFIKGVKQKGVWPFITDATDKVARATYDSSAWVDENMKRRGARPRFVPGVDVSSTQDLLDPTLQRPSSQMGTKIKGFLFAAAPWGQVAVEAKMPAIELSPITRRGDVLVDSPVTLQQGRRYAYHGVFSWAFLNSLRDLLIASVAKSRTKAVTYQQLLQEVEMKIKYCKSKDGGLVKLSQAPELTFYRAGGGEFKDLLLWPFGGKRRHTSYASDTRLELPCIPHETRYLSPWEAEEQLHRASELKRENDPALRQLRRYHTGNHQTPQQSFLPLGYLTNNETLRQSHDLHYQMSPTTGGHNNHDSRFDGTFNSGNGSPVNGLPISPISRQLSNGDQHDRKQAPASPCEQSFVSQQSANPSPATHDYPFNGVGLSSTQKGREGPAGHNRNNASTTNAPVPPIPTTPVHAKEKEQSTSAVQRTKSAGKLSSSNPKATKAPVPSRPAAGVFRNATVPPRSASQTRTSAEQNDATIRLVAASQLGQQKANGRQSSHSRITRAVTAAAADMTGYNSRPSGNGWPPSMTTTMTPHAFHPPQPVQQPHAFHSPLPVQQPHPFHPPQPVQQPYARESMGLTPRGTPVPIEIGGHQPLLTPRRLLHQTPSGEPGKPVGGQQQQQQQQQHPQQHPQQLLHRAPSGMTHSGLRMRPYGAVGGTSLASNGIRPSPRGGVSAMSNRADPVLEPTPASREAFERYAREVSLNRKKAEKVTESRETDLTTTCPNTQSSETVSNAKLTLQRSSSMNGIGSFEQVVPENVSGTPSLSQYPKTPSLQYQESMKLGSSDGHAMDLAETPTSATHAFQTTTGHARSYDSDLGQSTPISDLPSTIPKSPRQFFTNTPSLSLSLARSRIGHHSIQAVAASASTYRASLPVGIQTPRLSSAPCIGPTIITRQLSTPIHPPLASQRSSSLPRPVNPSRSVSGPSTYRAAGSMHQSIINWPAEDPNRRNFFQDGPSVSRTVISRGISMSSPIRDPSLVRTTINAFTRAPSASRPFFVHGGAVHNGSITTAPFHESHSPIMTMQSPLHQQPRFVSPSIPVALSPQFQVSSLRPLSTSLSPPISLAHPHRVSVRSLQRDGLFASPRLIHGTVHR